MHINVYIACVLFVYTVTSTFMYAFSFTAQLFLLVFRCSVLFLAQKILAEDNHTISILFFFTELNVLLETVNFMLFGPWYIKKGNSSTRTFQARDFEFFWKIFHENVFNLTSSIYCC